MSWPNRLKIDPALRGVPSRDRSDGSGQISSGDLRSPSGARFGVRDHWLRPRSESAQGASAAKEEMKQPTFPEGWDEERVRRVLEHYDAQSDEEAVAEDEAAYESTTHTAMEIPVELVPEVRELLAKKRAG